MGRVLTSRGRRKYLAMRRERRMISAGSPMRPRSKPRIAIDGFSGGGKVSAMKNATAATVFIADDDAETLQSIEKVLRSVGLRVESFASIDALVAGVTSDRLGCIVLSLRRHAGPSLDPQQILKER